MKKHYKKLTRLKSGKLISWLGRNYCQITYAKDKWAEPKPMAKKLGYLLCVFYLESENEKYWSCLPNEEYWECEIGEVRKTTDWPKFIHAELNAKDLKHYSVLWKDRSDSCPWMSNSVMTDKVKLIRKIK